MRLALITQDFPPSIGGIQTYSYEIARRIHSRCEDFLVVAPAIKGHKSFDADLSFDVMRIKTPEHWLGLIAIPRLLPEFKNRKIDTTFHAQWQTIPIGNMSRKFCFTDHIFCSVHARELIFNPYFGYAGSIFSRVRQKLLESVTHFFPVSQYSEDLLLQLGIAAERCSVVMNGTDPNRFFPKPVDDLKLRLGLSQKKILLTITRLVSRKGIDTVLKALKILGDDFRDLHYVIVGEGDHRSELLRLTEELDLGNRTTFTGRIDPDLLNDYYNLADIFVMPTKTVPPDIEGFGIVFLEAGSCGKPVIGSTSGGISSAVIHNETGLLVNENDPDELALAIKKILSNPDMASRMGKKGRDRVLSETNWDTASEKLYQLMANKKTGQAPLYQ